MFFRVVEEATRNTSAGGATSTGKCIARGAEVLDFTEYRDGITPAGKSMDMPKCIAGAVGARYIQGVKSLVESQL